VGLRDRANERRRKSERCLARDFCMVPFVSLSTWLRGLGRIFPEMSVASWQLLVVDVWSPGFSGKPSGFRSRSIADGRTAEAGTPKPNMGFFAGQRIILSSGLRRQC